jgi:hypothetical protein
MYTNENETVTRITNEGVELMKKHNRTTELLKIREGFIKADDQAGYMAWISSLPTDDAWAVIRAAQVREIR